MKDVQAVPLKRAMRLERYYCCFELERTHCNDSNEEDHKVVILECTDETNKQEWLDTIQEHLKKMETNQVEIVPLRQHVQEKIMNRRTRVPSQVRMSEIETQSTQSHLQSM